MLKAFTASRNTYGSYGYYDELECIVVANTDMEALGMVLEEYRNTKASEWLIFEIDITKPGVEEISHDQC